MQMAFRSARWCWEFLGTAWSNESDANTPGGQFISTIICFVQVAEGPVLCVQRCEAQAKSNNNKPAARVAQSSQDRQEGSTGL